MFYEDLKKEVLNLISQNRLQEALQLIETELAVPYVPRDFEKFLLDSKKEVLGKLSPETPLKNLNIELISQQLLSKNVADQSIAIDNLKKINVRQILKPIQTYLKRKNVPSNFKSLVLIILYNQGIDQNFELFKNSAIQTVNPQKIGVPELLVFFNKAVDLIEENVQETNQTIIQNAAKLALLFLLNHFPNALDFTENDLTAMALKKSYDMLGIKVTWSTLSNKLRFDETKAIALYEIEQLV